MPLYTERGSPRSSASRSSSSCSKRATISTWPSCAASSSGLLVRVRVRVLTLTLPLTKTLTLPLPLPLPLTLTLTLPLTLTLTLTKLERAPASTVTQSRVGARRKQQLHPIGSGAEDRFVQRRAATCVLRAGLRTCCE